MLCTDLRNDNADRDAPPIGAAFSRAPDASSRYRAADPRAIAFVVRRARVSPTVAALVCDLHGLGVRA